MQTQTVRKEVVMTNRIRRFFVGAGIVAALIATMAPAANADIELAAATWQTVSATGMVQFHLRWHNPSLTETSMMVSGEAWAQKFGVFLPNESLIGPFQVPPMAPDSFFDVFFEVPLAALPQAPAEGYTAKPAGGGLPGIPCPPGDHWDGNIDILWGGPGGNGHVNYHIGQIMVCPGLGTSYIHMIVGCPQAAGWVINGVCPGWTVTLRNEDLTAAPNPVPPGWTGWIAITAGAGVPVGLVCCFNIVFTCGVQTATVQLCATACQCPTVGIEPNTWGILKQLYR